MFNTSEDISNKTSPHNGDTFISGKIPDKGSRRNILQLIVIIVLIIAIVFCITAIYYIFTKGEGDKFTEFYILGTDGKAHDYPVELRLEDDAKVILGIVNHEYSEMSYIFKISIDQTVLYTSDIITLDREEKWEKVVSFKPTKTGMNQRVDFILYKQTNNASPLTLNLWINVSK